MPFSIGDVAKHTKKATTAKLKRQWVEVANSVLEKCEGTTEECDASAITQANGVIAKESTMEIFDIDGQQVTLDELTEAYIQSKSVPTQEQNIDKVYMMLQEVLDILRQPVAMESTGLAVSVARDATADDLSEIDATVEEGRRAPVVIDFQVLQPGPGNKRDGHYYPADVVERDIHVFSGVDVFATDHNEQDRSERTKVGKVLSCPTMFTESKAPVAQVLIYDPDQAEKARNRADADALDTLECSILGSGRAKDGEIDGQKYKIVEAITDGRYLELVSKAGAGGKALNLAETAKESIMEEKEKADATPVEEVEIEEAEATVEPDVKKVLDSEVIGEALKATNLPEFVKATLAEREYENDTTLQEAIDSAVAEVKKLTGSGKPKELGVSESVEDEPVSLEEREKQSKADFNAIMQEVGLKGV